MSMPFFGQSFTFTQPNGDEVRVRGWGDQYFAYFESEGGVPLLRDPISGALEVAQLDVNEKLRTTGILLTEALASRQVTENRPPVRQRMALRTSNRGLDRSPNRWQVRRERRRRSVLLSAANEKTGVSPAPPPHKTVGRFVGLCVLVEFPNERGSISPAEVERFLNAPGYSGFGNRGSVRDYFLDVSMNRLDYGSLVTTYVMARRPRDYYTDEKVRWPSRTYELLDEVLEILDRDGFDFGSLTVDDEQYVLATNILYAGPRVNNWSTGLWPHAHHLPAPRKLQSGRLIHDYQITNMGTELTLGTYCHENGHMICEFPDLYDYGGESAGVGAYCLMCGGGSVDEKNPTHVSAYLKYQAGWASRVVDLASSKEMVMSPMTNEMALYRRNASEYFLLENRHRERRDASLPSAGLAIWHIDERGSNNHEQGTEQEHYECALKQADGRRDLELRRELGDATDLFPIPGKTQFDSRSNPGSLWWDGSPSRLSVSDIRKVGDEILANVAIEH
jgi:M6 family metalloprotease-like protein